MMGLTDVRWELVVVQAEQTNLESVLEGKKQYAVPLFQRTYAWRPKHVDRLWTDLIDIARVRRTTPDATHFIGSLVLASSPGVAAVGMSRFLVVDGQQRLTTLSLLLAALRDYLVKTGGEEHREGIDTQYLINKFVKDQPAKLLPTQDDRATYEAVVRSVGTVPQDDRIGATYHHLLAKIAKLADEEDPVSPEELEDAVLWGLALVAVVAEPQDNAHRIFESLNNTGLPLTQADLLKNYLFMRLGDRASAVYRAIWLPLEKKLTPGNLELLFWLDLVLVDENAKQADTHAGQQKRLDRLTTPQQIEDEISRIAKLGDVLATLLNPARESDPGVRYWLTCIIAWGSTTAYPVVMRILVRHAAGTATTEQVVNALRCLVSYFVRRIVIGRATAGINKTLLQAVAAVANEPEVDIALRAYLSRGRKHFATDAQVRESVGTVAFYHHGRREQQNLILQWLEESYSGKEKAELKGLTIEHVLPQTLSEATRDEFAETLAEAADIAVEHERLVHTLGNLTLTGYNSEMSNRPFAQKRRQLAKSPLELNKTIATHAIWGVNEITTRSQELADRIIQLWPGPDESLVDLAETEGLAVRIAPIVERIPAGNWTSYSEVAIVVGSHPVAVGTAVANNPIAGAWRVLTWDGKPSAQFRWNDPDRTEPPTDFLAAEGIRFDESGRADPAQQLDARALADAIGLDIDDALIATRRNKIWRKDRGSTQHGETQVAYWTRLRRWCGLNATHVKLGRTPKAQAWYDIAIGRSGIDISLVVNSVEQRVNVQLRIADDKALFSHLEANKEAIESDLGYSVEWDDRPERKATRVFAAREGDFRDANQQLELIAWQGRIADDFGRVFPSYIRTAPAT
jgi:O6-methylguanine-DNA--protein-cysteine methyltransferase